MKEIKKILIVGGGGREHAIAWALDRSQYELELFCIPGNAGIADIAKCIPGDVTDITAIADFVTSEGIDLTIVGPELPLALGIVDEFEARGLIIFGPNKEAARLESSKGFAKNFMRDYNIPTADFRIFLDAEEAAFCITTVEKDKWVIKADGLAAGKGVYVCNNRVEALKAIREIMIDRKFGDAGNSVIIEDYIEGFEASYMVFMDGDSVQGMPISRDFKRLHSGAGAPNTGGMGTYAPHDLITPELVNKINDKILTPTRYGLKALGIKYTGVLYIGLMIQNGEPYVLEYNIRFGDPETQVVLPLLESDFAEIIVACTNRGLHRLNPRWYVGEYCVCKIAASEGYPGSYEKGKVITGLSRYRNAMIFHAGTKKVGDKIVTNGGRVLGVVNKQNGLRVASHYVDKMLQNINFEGKIYREDIGKG